MVAGLKSFVDHPDFTLAFLSRGIINRNLLKVQLKNEAFDSDLINKLRLKVELAFEGAQVESKYLVFTGSESNSNYSTRKREIKIAFKDGRVLPMSETSDHEISPREVIKYYLCFPKEIRKIPKDILTL